MATEVIKKSGIQSLVSRDYLVVSDRETVGSTLEVLRKRKEDLQNKLAYLYVTDDTQKLLGVLRVRDLLIEKPTTPIIIIMEKSVIDVTEDALLEDVLRIFRTYSFFAVPVTDQARRIVGIISAKQVQKYLNPAVPRTFYQFVNFSQEEVEGKSVGKIVLKRLPWLLISVTSGLVCAYILGLFIGKIESIVALILFVPIILGLAGSVGTQSAQVTVRGLREGKLSLSKIGHILRKEILMSLIIGGIALLLTSLIALLWKKNPVEGFALGVSIIAVMPVSGILGIILPITFRALRVNSNFASGLFLLLICDIVALILYFMISLSLVTPTLELG